MSITITEENFDTEVIQSSVPVLLDFWAGWCVPCRMVAPVLEQIAAEYKGRLVIGKVNVDEENDLASKHNIVSIPALILYKNGTIVQQRVGALPKHEIINFLKSVV
jgi:thioredoxin 1